MIEAPMWRVKFSRTNRAGSTSSGDWNYYEAKDYDRMEGDILEALLNGEAGDGGMRQGSNRLARIFRNHQRPELESNYKTMRRNRVIEVAYLKGDEWVSVDVSWSPPSVQIYEPSDG